MSGDTALGWIQGWHSWPWEVCRVAPGSETDTPVRLQQGHDIRYLSAEDALDLAYELQKAVAITRNLTACTNRDEDHIHGRMRCGFCLVAVECRECGEKVNPNVDTREGLCPHCNAPMRAKFPIGPRTWMR